MRLPAEKFDVLDAHICPTLMQPLSKEQRSKVNFSKYIFLKQIRFMPYHPKSDHRYHVFDAYLLSFVVPMFRLCQELDGPLDLARDQGKYLAFEAIRRITCLDAFLCKIMKGNRRESNEHFNLS